MAGLQGARSGPLGQPGARGLSGHTPGPSAHHLHSPLVFVAVMTHVHEAWNIHSEPLDAFPSDSPSHTEQL